MYKYKYTIEDCHKEAAKKNGEFRSLTYLRSNDYYFWKCENQDHNEFKKTFTQVLANQWCPQCKYDRISQKLRGKHTKSGITHDINFCRKIAQEKGGECLSTEYINNRKHLLWRCSEGHEWNANLNSIYLQRTWCPKCVGKNKNVNDCIALAEKYSGEYLDSKYEGYSTNVKWRCNNGHVFEKSYESISTGRWCPDCSKYVGEKIARGILERIFNCSFKKIRPKELKNKKGNILELDGYNKKLKLAFEYQGEQHYRYIPFFHGNINKFEQRVVDDQIKIKWCQKMGIKLLVIPMFNDYLDLNENFSIVENLLKQLKIEIPEYIRPVTIGEIIQSDYSELDLICRSHNGRLITDAFLGWAQLHEFECANFHRWKTTADAIRRGSWCRVCQYNKIGMNKRKYTVEDAKKIAEKKVAFVFQLISQ